MKTLRLMSFALIVLCSTYVATALRAVCLVQPNPGSSQPVTGVVKLEQACTTERLTINVKLSGFNTINATAGDPRLKHGFHVHEKGNLTGGCDSTLGHYNPFGVNHGGPDDAVRHVGDFGNIEQTPEGTVDVTITDRVASLFGTTTIIGRGLVVHSGEDDLGKGGQPSSLTTGNAGPRLGCCVITLA
uniref:Superoxide dismutase [Cu-Zn] n=1 Tax=Arion vulgaris TaxID=1028688 RepID=A0A0B6ZR11_9EUPU